MSDGGDQFEIFPTDLHLRWIDPVQNARRFYQLSVQRDLFGSASFIKVWGRIGTQGRQMIGTYPDKGRAVTALNRRRGTKPARFDRPHTDTCYHPGSGLICGHGDGPLTPVLRLPGEVLTCDEVTRRER